MLLELGVVRRELRLVAAGMLGNELRGAGEFGNRMRGIERLVLKARDELRAARVVRAEEMELAVVERAAQREAHARRRAAFGLDRVVHRPDERLHRRLLNDVRRDHEVLRTLQERRQDRALELALGLFARQLRRALDLGLALREEDGLLRRALAPFLDRLRLAHHLNVRAVLVLGHVRELRPNHLLHRRVELVDVRRPKEDARKPALRDAAEIALRRLAVNHLRVVVVAEVRRERMRQDVLLARRGEPAGLALAEGRGLRVGGGGRTRRDLQQDRLGIVEEEIRELLEFVGVRIALQLADDRAERLRLGQNLHLAVERARTFPERLARAKGLAVAHRLAITERALLAHRLAVAERLAGPVPTPRLACPVGFGTNLSDTDPGTLLRPGGREVDGPEIKDVSVLFAHGSRIISYRPHKTQQPPNLPKIPHLVASKNIARPAIQEATLHNVGHNEISWRKPPLRDIRIFLSLPRRQVWDIRNCPILRDQHTVAVRLPLCVFLVLAEITF